MDQKQFCNPNDNGIPTSASSTLSKNKNQLSSGNFINVVPMTIVNSSANQYHSRRKYPSDYQ